MGGSPKQRQIIWDGPAINLVVTPHMLGVVRTMGFAAIKV